MKVFAHYMGNEKDWNLSEDGFQYRWRTLLKFGDSWNVIGSVIMKIQAVPNLSNQKYQKQNQMHWQYLTSAFLYHSDYQTVTIFLHHLHRDSEKRFIVVHLLSSIFHPL